MSCLPLTPRLPRLNSGRVSPITQVMLSSSRIRVTDGGADAELAGPRLLGVRQAAGQDGDEDDVVDAQDDLERRQRQELNEALDAEE